jgi:hypothetical protein
MRFSRLVGLLGTVSVVVSACTSKSGQQPTSDGATDRMAMGSGANADLGAAIDSGLAACGYRDSTYCETSVFATSIDAGTACLGDSHLNCDGLESYVDISGDGDPIRLAYPMDPSCGTCGNTSCQIWGRYSICCSTCDLTFAACAGPDGAGPCLDFHNCGRYVDRDAKTWMATLVPLSLESDAPLDLQATATVTDGTTTRSLSIHIHICGFTNYCGIIC